MNNLAVIVDYTLWILAFTTYLAILYKVLDLYKPSWLGKPKIEEALSVDGNARAVRMDELESWLTFIAVVASAAPFIGLAGTVLHIMDALRTMGATADIKIISGPIATALNSTLVGLCSAIPAAVSHAFFQRRLQVIENRSHLLSPARETEDRHGV